MSKQEYFGLNYSLDTLNVSSEEKSQPRLIGDFTTTIPINVIEEKDLLFYNEHVLNIFAVSRAVIKRTAIPINGTYTPGTATIVPPYSEILNVINTNSLIDTNYYLDNTNVLVDLKVFNSEAVVDEIPTMISETSQQPFWS
jgi:hypothetical protein